MGCFVVASSFPVPSEYPAGKSWQHQRNPLPIPIKPDSTAVQKILGKNGHGYCKYGWDALTLHQFRLMRKQFMIIEICSI